MFDLNPWVLLGAALAVAGAGWQGYRMGGDAEVAARARDAAVAERVRDEVLKGTAEQIAAIKVVNQTIRSKVEVQTRDVPVYRDCVNTPDAVQLLDAAREGIAPSESAGDSSVPSAEPGQPPHLR